MTLDFAYTLFLILQKGDEVPKIEVKRYIQKWFILSTLTGRYIGSPESQMDRDLRGISSKGFISFLKENEDALLSDAAFVLVIGSFGYLFHEKGRFIYLLIITILLTLEAIFILISMNLLYIIILRKHY